MLLVTPFLSLSRFKLPSRSAVRLFLVAGAVLAFLRDARAADDAAKQTFDLRAGEAEQTLKQFSEQSGRQVIFPTDIVQGIRTRAVKGDYTVREALDRMLEGTGLIATQDETTGAFAVRRQTAGGDPAMAGDPPAEPAPSVSSTASGQSNLDQVLTLPEFSVSASSANNSYTAGDTMSGSRMNADVKNLAYSIASMTSDFMKDFSIFDLTDELSNMSEITGNTDSFTYQIRGYGSSNIVIYNGHEQYSPIVAAFVERVELVKGPAGSIYGQSAPGGAIIITTNQPTAGPFQEMRVAEGTAYHFGYAYLRSTGPIPVSGGSKLFYNIQGLYQHRTFDVQEQRRQEKAVDGSVTWKPDDKTVVLVEATWQKYYNPNSGDWGLPFSGHFGTNPYTGAVGQITYDGYAWALRHAYYGSPVDYVTRESSQYMAQIQHRFTDWLSAQGGYEHYVSPTETYNTLGSGGFYFPSAGLIAPTTAKSGAVNTASTANPAWSTIMGTGWSVEADLLAHYHIGAAVDNQTLLTIDDYLNNRRNYSETPIAGTFTPSFNSFNPFVPVTPNYVPRDSNHWTSSNTLNNAVDSEGFGLTDRAVLWNGALTLSAGYRHDHVTGYELNPAAATTAVAYTGAAPGSGRQSFVHSDNDGADVGASVPLNGFLSWYASVYQAFTPFGTSVPLTVTIPATANAFQARQLLKTLSPSSTKATGEETGFKMDYLNHAIVFTADVFDTHQKNVLVTELYDPTNPSSPTVSVNEGDQNATGFELDGEYNMTSLPLHFSLSYTYLNAEVLNQGVNVWANGHRPRGVPYNSLASALSYRITAVPGLRLLMNVRYQGNTQAQSPSTGLITNPATGLNDTTNGEAMLRTPAYAVWNFGAVYSWKTGSWKHSLNAMVKNAFDKEYIQPGNSTTFVGDGRGAYFTFDLSH